jgi:hypothetical protein
MHSDDGQNFHIVKSHCAFDMPLTEPQNRFPLNRRSANEFAHVPVAIGRDIPSVSVDR